MPVTLINCFEVPEEEIDAAIELWRAARDDLAVQPGYVSTRLHRRLGAGTGPSLVNVATWESAAAFRAAVSRPEFAARTAELRRRFPGAPALYEVAFEDPAPGDPPGAAGDASPGAG